ncbi:hypothetical protein P692DRAFT_20354292 [Suillus brevipes Sb2]|nr:hypothetical protein P692DRAFT_20354292 [Suillus brevipes Sb2]
MQVSAKSGYRSQILDIFSSFVSSSISPKIWSTDLSIPHLIHRVLPFSAGLEALCLSRAHGTSIIEQPSFVFSPPSIKDIFPSSIHHTSPSIPRIIVASLILMVSYDPAFYMSLVTFSYWLFHGPRSG